MKIIFVCNDGAQCGIADYSKNLLQELGKLAAIDLVLMPDLVESAESGSLFRYMKNGCQAYSLARRMPSGDICHIQHEYALWGGLRPVSNVFPYFTTACHLPVVLTLHELAHYRAVDVHGKLAKMLTLPLRPLADHYSAYINRKMFDFPRALIVHTEAQHQELLRRGVPGDKIHLIPHGIPDLDAIKRDAQVLKRFGLKKSSFLVIIGFISQRKGYDIAVEALKYLPGDIRLVFAGGSRTTEDEGYEEELRRLIFRLGLAKRVVITGYLDMASLKFLVKESLFVLAPYYQASGSGSLSLALSLGKSILASRSPAMVELAQRSKALELCNDKDPIDLAAKTKELLDNPERVSGLETEGKRYAIEMSFKNIAAHTVSLYQKIAR